MNQVKEILKDYIQSKNSLLSDAIDDKSVLYINIDEIIAYIERLIMSNPSKLSIAIDKQDILSLLRNDRAPRQEPDEQDNPIEAPSHGAAIDSNALDNAANQRHSRHDVNPSENVLMLQAQRISNLANEEYQRQQIMLQLQQTRNRQNLQRKLLERRNTRQQINGLSSTAEANALYAMRLPSKTSPKNHSKGSADLSSDPTSRQQQITMRSMLSRGMNLTPMMRK